MSWTGSSGGPARLDSTSAADVPAGLPAPASAASAVVGTPRSMTVATTAIPTATTALIPAVTWSPVVNDSRAAASRAAPTPAGSCWATPTAPPRVSRAAAEAWLGTPAGRRSASPPR
jgi:hypothetical protein